MAWSRVFSGVVLGCACAPNPVFGVRDSAVDETSSGTTGGAPTGGVETSTTTAVSPTSSEPDTMDPATSGSSTGGSSTGELEECALLCGAPLACCVAGSECVAGACADACASAVRCGDALVCCEVGEACVEGACVAAGEGCIGDLDCDAGDFCDPADQQCLPRPEPAPTCALQPGDPFAVELQWSVTTDEVINIPLVADVNGDGLPEIVINTTRADGNVKYEVGEVVCLDGATGAELWRISEQPPEQHGAQGFATLGVANLSADEVPDILYAGRTADNQLLSAIHAVSGVDGSLLWTSHDKQMNAVKVPVQHGAPAVANLDGDPEAEFAFGGSIFDNDGLLVHDKGGLKGSPHKIGDPGTLYYSGGLPVFADLTGDEYPELITGSEAWTVEWTPNDPPTVKLDLLWKDSSGEAGDGWPAVADLDGNGTPEVVLVAYPEIKVLDGNTGNLWCGVDPSGTECNIMPSKLTQPVDLPGTSVGGPVAIADFDGDGRLEFGLSIGASFVVYDLFRDDEQIVKPPMDPFPKAGSIFRRWVKPVRDLSSASAGASAFDFDGDGAAEVLFQDECFSRVYDGETGAVRVEIMNSSATIHEYPVVADVDGDGRSELVVVANLSDEVLNEGCPPGHVPRKGVYVYRNAEDRWAPTRRVWTEHSHHVTNAEAAGIVPVQEASHWTVPGRNNFRQGPHGPVLTNAPDLAASLAIDVTGCPQTFVLRATIFNKGSLGVPAGIDVAFYAGPEPGQAIGAGVTEVPLGPGGFTFVEVAIDAPAGPESYRVVVDAGDAIAECDEDNNHAEVTGAACP